MNAALRPKLALDVSLPIGVNGTMAANGSQPAIAGLEVTYIVVEEVELWAVEGVPKWMDSRSRDVST